MQERELNCATIVVANRTDISGRATAEKNEPRLANWKREKLWAHSQPNHSAIIDCGWFRCRLSRPAGRARRAG